MSDEAESIDSFPEDGAEAAPAPNPPVTAAESPPSENESSESAENIDGEGKEPTKADDKEEKKEQAEEEPKEGELKGKEGTLYHQLRRKEAKLIERERKLAATATERDREIGERELYARNAYREATAILEHAKKDPLDWLQKFAGLDKEALAGRILNDGRPSEGEVLKKYQQEVEDMRRELRDRDMREAATQRTRAQEAALHEFAEKATAGEDKWPLVSQGYDASELKAEAWRIANEHAARGVRLTDEEILDKMEETEARRNSRRQERGKQNGAASVSASKVPAKAPNGHQANGHHTPAAPSLTNRVAADRTSSEDEDVLDLTPEQEHARVLAALKRARGNASP